MKESVQGWRNKWFYLRDPAVSGRRSNLPLFDDVLAAQKKKSWQNALSPEEKATADELFEQIVTLKNTGGLTMCGTEVVSVFLQYRVQPLMSRPHQLWLYTGKGDKSRINSADLSADELRDEVRRLTCLIVVRCYPPSPESGVEPEDDDDDSDEGAQQVLEDSDVQEGDTAEDATFTRSRRRLQIDDDFITTAESSPSDQDNDAVGTPPPSPVKKSSTSFFVDEDDLDLSDDDDVPLAKRAKLVSERAASAKESDPSPAKSTPPTRTAVEKIPVSKVIPPGDPPASLASRDHPIYATVDAVADFAEQFTRLEAENAQLRKSVKTSADQVLEANRFLHLLPCSALSFSNPSSNDESGFVVRRLRDQVSSLDKDITSLRAMAALVKKKGEIATAIEQYALDGLHVATESLGFVASDATEENKKIHEEVEMTDVAHPTHGLWLHRPKAVVMAKFKYRVMKAHYYFDKYHAHLTMVWNTLFPLDQAPETLSGLFTRFKSPERIRQLVRKELLAGAELAFASILACHPSLDLRAIAKTDRNLGQYYDVARGPAYTVVSRMESCLEKELKAHWDRGTRL
ncbi:hypothetical protein QYE76_022648 [Lolium multiflorum]|uniref:Uncharacterized protein n=1 Tax=Lolium multiflorum TaxID=4521 RepID=A0AAD8RA68_LOLMU|nr:hypothetical protein QYE76_022648 [Lolium multiflorum]